MRRQNRLESPVNFESHPKIKCPRQHPHPAPGPTRWSDTRFNSSTEGGGAHPLPLCTDAEAHQIAVCRSYTFRADRGFSSIVPQYYVSFFFFCFFFVPLLFYKYPLPTHQLHSIILLVLSLLLLLLSSFWVIWKNVTSFADQTGRFLTCVVESAIKETVRIIYSKPHLSWPLHPPPSI